MIAATTFVSLMLLADTQDPVQTLVQEVRWLRGALSAGMRMQLTLHRIAVQERAAREAEMRLHEAQSAVLQIENERERWERLFKAVAQGRKPQHFYLGSNPEEEQQVLAEARKTLEALPQRLQEAKAKSQTADSQMRTEKHKLEDLNRQLDDIDRSVPRL